MIWTAAKIRYLLILGLLAGLVACTNAKRYGDVSLYPGGKGSPFGIESVGRLRFHEIALSRPQIFSFKVNDLPKAIYPTAFLLAVPAAESIEALHDQPWRACTIRASLLTAEGKSFYTRTIRLGEGRHGSGTASFGRRSIYFPFVEGKRSLPPYRSYILKVEILTPSLRKSDRLTVEAYTDYGVPNS